MCLSSPKAPPPAPPPPPPAPPAPVPELKLSKEDPSMDKSVNALNRKGRGRLRIDMTDTKQADATGLNIPQ